MPQFEKKASLVSNFVELSVFLSFKYTLNCSFSYIKKKQLNLVNFWQYSIIIMVSALHEVFSV